MADNVMTRILRVLFDRKSAQQVEEQLADSLASAGKKGGDNFLREVRRAFDKRMAVLKNLLAKGLINPADFRKQADLAAKEFNAGLLKGMEKARAAGKLTQEEYVKLSRQLKATGDIGGTAFDRIGASIKRAGAALAAAFSIRAIGRFIGGSVNEFATFDAAMARTLAIMEDVDDHLKNRMIATAKALGEEFNFAAAEVAKALYYLSSAGLSAENALGALPVVLRYAKAGAFDLATATDLLVDSQAALGLTSKNVAENQANMARVADVLTKANNIANGSVEDFSKSLTTKAGAALRLVNKDVEEGVAVLAAFAAQGTKGESAGERLSIVLREMQRAARDNGPAFAKLGIQVFDASGEMRNMADITEDIERALGPMSTKLKGATLAALGFTEKSIDGIKALIGYSTAIRGYEEQLRSAGGETQRVADKQMLAFSERWGQIKQQLANARAELGLTIIEALNLEKNLPRLSALIRAFANSVGDLVGLFGSLIKAVAIVAGVKGLLALRTAFATAAGGIALFRVGITRLYTAIGPAGWAIIGLTTLIDLFRRSGEAAEEAAEKAAAAVADFKSALGDMNEANLDAQQIALAGKKGRIEGELARERAKRVQPGVAEMAKQKKINELQEELNTAIDMGNALLHERNRRMAAAKLPKPPTPEDPEDEPVDITGGGGDKQLDRFKERRAAIQQEIMDLARLRTARKHGEKAVLETTRALADEAAIRDAVKDLTPQQAAEIRALVVVRNRERDAIEAVNKAEEKRQRQIATKIAAMDRQLAKDEAQTKNLEEMRREADIAQRMRDAERQGPDFVAALNRELYIQAEVLRSGAEAGSAYALEIAGLAEASYDAAQDFSTPWIDGLAIIKNEVLGSGTLFADLGRAWAEGGFAGIVALAKAKVKENIASAIEMGARALGAIGLGNPLAAGKYAASAAKHLAAAAAWGVAGQAGKGSGGGAVAGGGGSAVANANAGQNMQPKGPEVSIYLTGPGFDAINPEVQKVVFGAMQEARQRFGENATVRVVRRKT